MILLPFLPACSVQQSKAVTSILRLCLSTKMVQEYKHHMDIPQCPVRRVSLSPLRAANLGTDLPCLLCSARQAREAPAAVLCNVQPASESSQGEG
ncbi:hypothetical protein XENTR_v10008177 [Xenopus tropicalis]|nr:hypothetical protein XENTR_v10008177 [Xenopus tropicalis]